MINWSHDEYMPNGLQLRIETTENDSDYPEFYTYDVGKQQAVDIIRKLLLAPETTEELEELDASLQEFYISYLGYDYEGNNLRLFAGWTLYKYRVKDAKIVKTYYKLGKKIMRVLEAITSLELLVVKQPNNKELVGLIEDCKKYLLDSATRDKWIKNGDETGINSNTLEKTLYSIGIQNNTPKVVDLALDLRELRINREQRNSK
jgi:hypothetical protein